MSEKAVSGHGISRSPPPPVNSAEMGASREPRAPCQYRQGASLLIQPESTPTSNSLPSVEFDMQEAARNFEAYLNILKEWDEKEKRAGAQSADD